MKGNQKAGSNIKSFGPSASVEKGSNNGFSERGQIPTTPVHLDIKDFSRTKDTSCGVEYK